MKERRPSDQTAIDPDLRQQSFWFRAVVGAALLVALCAVGLQVMGNRSPLSAVLIGGVLVGLLSFLIAVAGWGVAMTRFWMSHDRDRASRGLPARPRPRGPWAYVLPIGAGLAAGGAYFAFPGQRAWLWQTFVIVSFAAMFWLRSRTRGHSRRRGHPRS